MHFLCFWKGCNFARGFVIRFDEVRPRVGRQANLEVANLIILPLLFQMAWLLPKFFNRLLVLWKNSQTFCDRHMKSFSFCLNGHENCGRIFQINLKIQVGEADVSRRPRQVDEPFLTSRPPLECRPPPGVAEAGVACQLRREQYRIAKIWDAIKALRSQGINWSPLNFAPLVALDLN